MQLATYTLVSLLVLSPLALASTPSSDKPKSSTFFSWLPSLPNMSSFNPLASAKQSLSRMNTSLSRTATSIQGKALSLSSTSTASLAAKALFPAIKEMNQSNEECILKYLEDANDLCNKDMSDYNANPGQEKKSRGWFTRKQLDMSEGCVKMRDGYKVMVNMARNMPSPSNADKKNKDKRKSTEPQDLECPQVIQPNTEEFMQHVRNNSNNQSIAGKGSGTAFNIAASAMGGYPQISAQTWKNFAGQMTQGNANPRGRIGVGSRPAIEAPPTVKASGVDEDEENAGPVPSADSKKWVDTPVEGQFEDVPEGMNPGADKPFLL